MNQLIFITLTLCLLTFSVGAVTKQHNSNLTGQQSQNFQKIDYSSIPNHPRLFLRSGEEEKIKDCIKKNTAIANVHNFIISYCNTLLTTPPKECSGSGRGVAIARATLKNVFWLSYAYRITRLEKYATRAKDEMISIFDYDNWAPEHYLDVAERLVAMAIGYDWLYPTLSPSTRKLIASKIIEMGLNPSYDSKYNQFFKHVNNWNPVCLAGITTASIAIYEETPKMAQELIEKCIENNPGSIKEYGPDGGYSEGYTYWGYGTSFQVMLIEALEKAFGTSAGLTEVEPAFFNSARYGQFLTTPAQNIFSYSDSETKAICSAINFWFADRNKDLTLIYNDMRELKRGNLNFSIEDRHLPLLIMFASRIDLKNSTPPTENYWLSRGTAPIFVYRSGWESNKDAYLGVKAGKATSPHGHMDAGSFFYEKDGVNWAVDLGTFSYNTALNKGISLWDFSQNGDRWKVFRTAAISHNTLTVNDNRHKVSGYATFGDVFKSEDKKGVQVNMTPALSNELKSATRNVWLDERNDLHVEDLITTDSKPAHIKWIMCTPATIKILSQNQVSLKYKNKNMILEVESPAEVSCEELSNKPTQKYDTENPGTSRICVNISLPANSERRIKVKLIDPKP